MNDAERERLYNIYSDHANAKEVSDRDTLFVQVMVEVCVVAFTEAEATDSSPVSSLTAVTT